MPEIVQTPPDSLGLPGALRVGAVCAGGRFTSLGAAHYLLPVELEPHRADLLRLWADALDAKDLAAAEREEFGPTIWRARAIADDPSAYEDRDFFALEKQFERAHARWRSATEPDPPAPTPSAPEP
jgi:hypothetical protein